MAEFLGWHFIGLRGARGRWERMATVGLPLAQIDAAKPLQDGLVMLYHDSAPDGGDYERDGDALIDSFKTELEAKPTGFDLKLTTTAPDAAYFSEHGSAPHMPPVDAIAPWALFHDIDPWALAISIAIKGTDAHPWQAKAREDALPIVDLIKARIAARVREELGV